MNLPFRKVLEMILAESPSEILASPIFVIAAFSGGESMALSQIPANKEEVAQLHALRSMVDVTILNSISQVGQEEMAALIEREIARQSGREITSN